MPLDSGGWCFLPLWVSIQLSGNETCDLTRARRRGPMRGPPVLGWLLGSFPSWVLVSPLCEGPHQPSPAVPTSSNLFFTQSLAFKYRMNQCLCLFCGANCCDRANIPGAFLLCLTRKALVSEKQSGRKNVKSSLNAFLF